MSQDAIKGEAGGPPWLWSLAAGVIFALAALIAAPLAGLPIRWAADGDKGEMAASTLSIAVFLVASVIWFVLVARRGRTGPQQGGVAGILVACFSYPAIIFLAEFFQADWQSLPDADNLLQRLGQVLALSIFALLTTGFAAMLVLGGVGLLAGAAQARLAGTIPLEESGQVARPILLGWIYRLIAYAALALVMALAAIFIILTLVPIPRLQQAATIPQPSATYEDALAAFQAIRLEEADLDLHPRCGTQLLTHGRQVEHVVIFFHGLTNCPAQADELAPELFAQGYNVIIPRLPGHGDANPLTLALADMSAEDLVATAGRAAALAQGLGTEVVVVGLSAGGTMTAYQTQHAQDVASAISVAPFLAPSIVPPWAVQAATNLLLWLPNMMVWWDPRSPQSVPEMDYAYPRFATHALAEVMRLGHTVSLDSTAAAPLAPHIGVLVNEADLAISNALVHQLMANWQSHDRIVDLQTLPLADGLPHDLIDPRQQNAATDIVYPLILEMIAAHGTMPASAETQRKQAD